MSHFRQGEIGAGTTYSLGTVSENDILSNSEGRTYSARHGNLYGRIRIQCDNGLLNELSIVFDRRPNIIPFKPATVKLDVLAVPTQETVFRTILDLHTLEMTIR